MTTFQCAKCNFVYKVVDDREIPSDKVCFPCRWPDEWVNSKKDAKEAVESPVEVQNDS